MARFENDWLMAAMVQQYLNDHLKHLRNPKLKAPLGAGSSGAAAEEIDDSSSKKEDGSSSEDEDDSDDSMDNEDSDSEDEEWIEGAHVSK